jgi:phage terminase large subunit
MAKTYILKEGSIHERFMSSTAKYQFFGGGYGNGKTSAMVVKTLQLANDYPGFNALMARSTYPKLNDTLRKTFIQFCPEEWIESFPLSKNSDNTCKLINGSTINFRYIAQKKATEDGSSTSNLLSATYDLAVVDQIEDPEIVYKDFTDIVGRLRGDTVYRGTNDNMPRTGPRWFFISSNPTRNWVYKRLIEPLKKYELHGLVTEDLLCLRDKHGLPILKDGKPQIMIDLIEGSTYENAHVLPADFIEALESTYRGQQGDRYLKGEWAAYEGLVYSQFNQSQHVIPHHTLMSYLRSLSSYKLTWLYSYDFGIASPSCFLIGVSDHYGNVFIIDGFYKKEARIDWQAAEMRKLRATYGGTEEHIFADPDIFRRKASGGKTVGKSVAELFFDEDDSLYMVRGNNDIKNGIVKIQAYLHSYAHHRHPISGNANAPYLYVSDRCDWLIDEFTGYYWDTNTLGDIQDKPRDRNDHALDALKYMLSKAPDPARLDTTPFEQQPFLTQWQEIEKSGTSNSHRY